MFESTTAVRRRSAPGRLVAFLASLALHLVLIGAVALLPLFFFRVLPELDLLTFLIAPPPPMPPPPLVAVGCGLSAAPRGRATPIRYQPQPVEGVVAPPADTGQLVLPSLVPGDLQGDTDALGAATGPAGSPFGVSAPAPTPLPPPKPPARAPLRIGGTVMASRLIRRVDPVYRDIARRARVSGVVILEVTIDEDGNVADIRVLRGQPLLEEETVRAVRQWKYSPTLLNGEPVPVLATVTVVFALK